MKDKDNNLIVIKGNHLIQDFKYKLSKTEMRVVNMIISNIDSPLYDEEFNMMKFHVTDFYKMLGWDNIGGNDYNRLKEVLKNLSNNSSDFISIGDGEKETIVRWIEKPYFHKKKGIVELKLDDDLKPYLLQVNGFFKAYLKYYSEMDSKYSMYIYELMKSWEGCKTKKFEISDFRNRINAEKKSYENFGKFHQGILKPAVEEINKVTDIELEYETITEGKKVTHIIFKINKKELKKINEENSEKTENPPVDEKEKIKDKVFFERFGLIAEAFPEFTQDQITLLYIGALQNLVLEGLTAEDRQDEVIDYIFPKLQKIKATPEETKSTVFYRLLNAVENNY